MIRLTLLLAFCIWLVFQLVPEPVPTETPAPEPVASEATDTGELTELTLETGEVWTIDRVITQGEPTPLVLPNAEVSAPLQAEEGAAPTGETPSTDAEIFLLYVTGTRVNLRAGPSTDNAIVAALDQGTATEFIAEAPDGWFQIRDQATGAVGFMSGDFLSPTQP